MNFSRKRLLLIISYNCKKYLSVGKADFEAFAALKMDSVGTEPDCEYGQVEPKPQNPMEAAKSKNQACGLN